MDQGTICSCQASRPPATPPPIRPRIEATRGQNLEDINTSVNINTAPSRYLPPMWPLLVTLGHFWSKVILHSCILRMRMFSPACGGVVVQLYLPYNRRNCRISLQQWGHFSGGTKEREIYFLLWHGISPLYGEQYQQHSFREWSHCHCTAVAYSQRVFILHTSDHTHTHCFFRWASLNADQNCFF